MSQWYCLWIWQILECFCGCVVTIVDSGLGVRGEETAVGQWLVGIWGYQQKHAHSMSQQVLLVDLEC